MQKKLARAVSKSDQNQQTVPPEILARGNKAKSAYQTALKSGQVKNLRLPIAVIGQYRSGKTSLLRSLNGEKFNPLEDSTIGAKLQRSLSQVEDGDWEKDETSGTPMLYNQFAAKEVVKYLMMPRSIDFADSNNFDYHEHSNYNSSIYDKHKLQNADFMSEVNIESESKTCSKEDKSLFLGENLKRASENSKPIQRDFQNDTAFVETEQLPEDVLTCAKNFLENPDSVKKMENSLYFHTMDFAGQPVYSVTHPVFLPPKGIFLLVHNLENDLHFKATPMVKSGAAERIIDDHCPMTNMDHLKFWLSLVEANSTLDGGSPVFVVSTHADKLPRQNAETIARKILLHLTRDDFSPGNHVVRGIHIVDNTISGSGGPKDPGVQNLKVAISNKARSLPQFDEDIPIRWLLFEKRLMSVVKEEKKKYISHEVAKSIALQCKVDVESDEFRTLLDYLHDLKVIIYFPETNMIIIDTQWLLDVFAKVITVLPIECHGEYEEEWEKLEDQGIVDETFLEYLWRDDHTPVQSLITIMEKFSLICKRQDGSYLVPAMLLNAPESHELMNTDEMASSLVIRFKSSHLPFGVFPRLFAAVHKLCCSGWPDSTLPGLSRNFARFYIVDDTFSLVLISDVQTITVALVNEETPGTRDDHLCSFLLKFLRETLPKMMESFPWMKSLEFEFGIRCPICEDAAPCTKHSKMACSRDSCAHFLPEKELLKKTKPRCHKNPTKRNIIPPSRFSHWFHRDGNNSAEVKEAQEQIQRLCLGACSTEDDALCKEVIAAVNQMSLKTISQEEATRTAKRIADTLNLDKHSTDTPPKEIIQKCRTSCRWLIDQGGEVLVEALRNELPSGMTGPLRYDVKVCDMDSVTKTQLSKELTLKKDQWKAFAKEKVGLLHVDIEFLDEREKNPVLEILNENCLDWSVEQLYDAVVSVGADAIADQYL